MSEYMTAFEMEIAAEGYIDTIREKGAAIFEVVRKLIKQCIDFLTNLIAKLRKNKGKGTNQDPTPNTQNGVTIDVYNCGKELNDILADLNFCMDMIAKRPLPDHKTNKSYGERWKQDNELIMERMIKCKNVIEKLNGIENKTVDLEEAEKLKAKFEALDLIYKKYARIYDTFANKHKHTNAFMIDTQRAILAISEIAGAAANINLSLMVPKDD